MGHFDPYFRGHKWDIFHLLMYQPSHTDRSIATILSKREDERTGGGTVAAAQQTHTYGLWIALLAVQKSKQGSNPDTYLIVADIILMFIYCRSF